MELICIKMIFDIRRRLASNSRSGGHSDEPLGGEPHSPASCGNPSMTVSSDTSFLGLGHQHSSSHHENDSCGNHDLLELSLAVAAAAKATLFQANRRPTDFPFSYADTKHFRQHLFETLCLPKHTSFLPMRASNFSSNISFISLLSTKHTASFHSHTTASSLPYQRPYKVLRPLYCHGVSSVTSISN